MPGRSSHRSRAAARAFASPERIGLAMDFYGPLLTDRCRRALELHYEEDLSFAEIAALLKDARGGRMTRQGAQRHIARGLSEMESLEEELGLVARHVRTRARLADLAARLRARSASPRAAADALDRIAESL